jgi:hypothetical protein
LNRAFKRFLKRLDIPADGVRGVRFNKRFIARSDTGAVLGIAFPQKHLTPLAMTAWFLHQDARSGRHDKRVVDPVVFAFIPNEQSLARYW